MLRCQWFESDGDVTICSGTPVSTIATSTTPMALVGSEGEETTIIEPGLTPDQTPTVQGDSSAATSLAPCPLLPTPSVPKVPSSSDSTALTSAVAGSMTVSPPLVFDSQLQATVSASASTPAANDVNSTSGLIDANASSFTPPPSTWLLQWPQSLTLRLFLSMTHPLPIHWPPSSTLPLFQSTVTKPI